MDHQILHSCCIPIPERKEKKSRREPFSPFERNITPYVISRKIFRHLSKLWTQAKLGPRERQERLNKFGAKVRNIGSVFSRPTTLTKNTSDHAEFRQDCLAWVHSKAQRLRDSSVQLNGTRESRVENKWKVCGERGSTRKKILLARTYLDSYGQIVLLYALVIQLMVNLDVGPGDGLLGTLLKVKRVKLVGLRGGSRHQPVKHRRIILDSRAVDTHTIRTCYKIVAGSPITSAFSEFDT